jgi:FdhD protein
MGLKMQQVSESDAAQDGWQQLDVCTIDAGGMYRQVTCDAVEEVPVAFSYGGIPYAVMMATPGDLLDLAIGFSITEGIAPTAHDIRDVRIGRRDEAFALDITLAPGPFRSFLANRRVRNLTGHTSCGLCGVEDLADLRAAPAPRVLRGGTTIAVRAIRLAVAALRTYQPLSQRTHAAHAAAWATADGRILLAREDVGRHCALDKLIGACLRANVDVSAGFCIVTSRCSFEMVQKAVMAGIPILVAVSAPTTLAVRTAQASCLTLIARATPDNEIICTTPARIRP